jgi:ubiquinone/menaquinone biosynthesis C-methylase UbiE
VDGGLTGSGERCDTVVMDQRTELQRIARATWAAGDYDAMMRQEGLYGVGAGLVEELGIGPGEEVLDVACGTGNAALPAAQAGARVTGLDLTPEMLAAGRSGGEGRGGGGAGR